MTSIQHPPISLLFDTHALKERPAQVRYEADAASCAALAEFAGLVGVESFVATFEISRSGPQGARVMAARVQGTLDARVIQTCSVTLEPFAAPLHETFDVRYSAESAPERGAERPLRLGDIDLEAAALQISLDEDDPPEAMHNGKIDLGALAREYFVLGLDPYPRKPGADLAEMAGSAAHLEVDAPPLPVDSPFAGLAALKPKD